jgi:hypothetical protein
MLALTYFTSPTPTTSGTYASWLVCFLLRLLCNVRNMVSSSGVYDVVRDNYLWTVGQSRFAIRIDCIEGT